MIVTLDEMKQYLRVDFEDDDALIGNLIQSGHQLCMDILRTDDPADLEDNANARTAVLYAVAYQYEHREEADHHALILTLRALLFGERKPGF